jgi:hypothetical protein
MGQVMLPVLVLAYLFLRKTGAQPRRRVLAGCLFTVVGLAGAATGPWHVKSTKDEMTGVTSFEGRMTAPVESNGRRGTANVFATCDGANLALRIVYYSVGKENPGFQYRDGNIIQNKVHVVLRISFDGDLREMSSTTDDHPNEVTLLFLAPPPNQRHDAQEGAAAIVGAIAALGGLSGGSPEKVFGANLIKIELPLANGDRPILEIHPKDPEFQRLASQCRAVGKEREQAVQEEERQEQSEKEQATIQKAGPLIQKYGLPSISDGHDTLVRKALVLKDKRLQGYWYGTDHDPLDDQRSTGAGTLSAMGVPGSPCGTIYDPGDVDPKTINWNAPDTQYIVVRCKDRKGNRVWGQMELMPAGLAELKRRREDLLELGVKESPAASEPDLPTGPKPEHWTRGAWATKKFYACPRSHFGASTPGHPIFSPQQPTPIQLLSHPGKLYLGKPEGEGETEYVFTWDSLHDDANSCTPTSTAATRPATANSPATPTVTGTVARPLRSLDNPGSDITDIYDQSIIVRASDPSSTEPVTTSDGGRFRKIIYPDGPKQKHIGGAVEFMAHLGPDGRVHGIETYVHAGQGRVDPDLVEAAIKAIKDWRFPRTGLQMSARINVRFDPN